MTKACEPALPKATRFRLTILMLALIHPAGAIHSRVFAYDSNTPKIKTQDQHASLTLEVDRLLTRELSGGQSHAYQIVVYEGQYLNVVVSQRGIDVSAVLFGPDEKQLLKIDGSQSPKRLKWVALLEGTYRLEVRSVAKEARAGGYDIKLAELRTATPGDRSQLADLLAAIQLEAEANKLSESGQYIKLMYGAGNGPVLSGYYFPPLPGTADEAVGLKAMMSDATVLEQAQATEGAIKRLEHPRILHIATHGFFLESQTTSRQSRGVSLLSAMGDASRSENPLLRSGLALAGANLGKGSNGDDGILTAQEAAGLNLWGTKLVVLSACDTGVGEVKTGEGVYGLRRALVLAGSETQMMSLWPVSDRGTRDLMIEFYRALQHGAGRSEALRAMQLRLLSRPDRAHPYFWASFIQSGEWATL